MPPEPPITTQAEILEPVDGRTYRAALPNGKEIHAHVPKRSAGSPAPQPGEFVTVELNPYDFSRARIRPGGDTPAAQNRPEHRTTLQP